MIGLDPQYLLFALPGLVLGLYASWKTRSTFRAYADVAASSGLSGAEAAARMLASQGVRNVRIEPTEGFLSDHFDPRDNTLRLSPDVYAGRSLAAIGVACHEAGHALQKATGYGALELRSALVPVTQLGSSLSWVVLGAGFVLHLAGLVYLGIALFATSVVFSLVTLPVELNASARAREMLMRAGLVTTTEADGVRAMLNAAALTYIAGAAQAVMQLLYFASLILGGRRR